MAHDDRVGSRLRDWLGATPAETAGLVLLLAGAVAVAAVLWWLGTPERGGVGDPPPSTVPGSGSAASPADAVADPAARGVPEDGAAVDASTAAPVIVHVGGAVARPGVFRLAAGARVADAVRAAGGARPGAAEDALNLARPLVDGERVLVPTEEEAANGSAHLDPDAGAFDGGAPDGDGPSGGPLGADGKLDLNRATAGDLDELPGIGPVLAQRILDWREANGPFTAVTQLREVSGIGERRYEQLEDLVAVR
jgi:competence protein ComEA